VAKLPAPPPHGQLAARLPADVKRLPPGTLLWRLYFRGGSHPTAWNGFRHFGPVPNARFDHHSSPTRQQSRGILYAAVQAYTCVAELFQVARVIERSENQPWLVGFELTRPVSLLDLTRTWPTKAGASMTLCSGRRDRARAWSLRIYEDYAAIEGLYYPSSMDGNRPAVALYERAQSALSALPIFNRALDDPMLNGAVATAAWQFNYRLET
jgi:hypothetical protein